MTIFRSLRFDDVNDLFIIFLRLWLVHSILQFSCLLLLAFQVVLGEVTTLALSIGVVRLIRMDAIGSHFGLSTVVVTLVAHVFGVLFLVGVGTGVSGFSLFGDWLELGLILDDLIGNDIKTCSHFFFGSFLHLDQVEELP
jgi:hypothetical protein